MLHVLKFLLSSIVCNCRTAAQAIPTTDKKALQTSKQIIFIMHNIKGQRKSVVLQGKLRKIGQEHLGKVVNTVQQ